MPRDRRGCNAPYLTFAQHALELTLPITLVAGFDMVDQTMFVPAKRAWFTDAPQPVRCHERPIATTLNVEDWEVPQGPLLDPFFANILDACDLDNAEWRELTWPKT